MLIQDEPEWFESAPKKLREILNIMLSDKRGVYKDGHDPYVIRLGNMKESFESYLNEATEFAGYAGLFD